MSDDAWQDDAEGADDDTTAPCPYCGREIYDDAIRCPHCGNYLSAEDQVSPRKPRWIVVGVALALAGAVGWFLARI